MLLDLVGGLTESKSLYNLIHNPSKEVTMSADKDNGKVAFIFLVIPFLVFVLPMLIAYGIWNGFKVARAMAREVNESVPY